MQLGLGTAQFGSAYGVTNPSGQVPEEMVALILRAAERLGVRLLDTAAAYGLAEESLGRTLWSGHPFRIVTKTQPISSKTISPRDIDTVHSAFLRSLDRIKTAKVAGLLVHHSGELLLPGGAALADLLRDLKSQGKVEKIGFSCYTPEDLEQASTVLVPDLVQVPASVLDRRFIDSGVLSRMKAGGTEVHARSIFLQGLLLTRAIDHPPRFLKHREVFQELERRAAGCDSTPAQFALEFIRTRKEIDAAVVGVCSARQLEEICVAALNSGRTTCCFDGLASGDLSLLIPSRWNPDATTNGTPS